MASTAASRSGPLHDGTGNHAKLQDQAATAALYVTGKKNSTSKGHEFLDSDNRLSSSAAATSLKYANPQDLPSFPSAGLKKNDSAANTAASLGWANQQPFEHWKPDASASASKAALLAKDYKMAPSWTPGQSTNGAKAALLAHKSSPKVEAWRPEATPWGNAAATQAFQKSRNGASPSQTASSLSGSGRHGSLLAATGAMAGNRRRAESTPIALPKPETYPDEVNASTNALRAATSAHKSRKSASSVTGGSSPYTQMAREMYTSHPPVAPEVEEQTRRDTLHASAVAMARGMYARQQQQLQPSSAAQSGASAAQGREASAAGSSERGARYPNLQEAANKLAQERLAKLHDEHSRNREYQDYYGVDDRPRSRLSIQGRGRRRANSDGSLSDDKAASAKIRAQMSIFSSTLTEVDAKKRQRDREALIAIAQRNVAKELHGMDEKVFSETGKAPPALLSEWEIKAHAAAQANSKSRMENHGKIDIGGGKFVDQSEIDKVARRNVQPMLDELNEKAEVERVKQAEAKLDEERRVKEATDKKAREKEVKEVNKKMKQQDKDEEKARKAEEKAARDEERRLAKEKRKSAQSQKSISSPIATTESKDTHAETEPASPSSPTHLTDKIQSLEPPTAIESSPKPEMTPSAAKPAKLATRRDIPSTPAPIRTSMEDQAGLPKLENADAANRDESTPMSPGTGRGRVKTWLKGKFGKKDTKHGEKDSPKDTQPTNDKKTEDGHARDGDSSPLTRNPVDEHESSSNVAPLVSPVSSMSSSGPDEATYVTEEVKAKAEMNRKDADDDDDVLEARDGFNEDLAPPPSFPAGKSRSPVRETRFVEAI